MKILIISNGGLEKANGKYYTSKHTVQFVKELIDSGLDVGFLQFNEIIQGDEIVLSSVFPEEVSIYSIPLNKGKLEKILSYFKIIKLMNEKILQYDFIYIFYPGYTSILASFISIFLRKKYGLYIRGEYHIDSRLGNFIIKRAKFCLTVSDLLKTKLNNKHCDIIAPMIDFSKKDILKDRGYSKDGLIRCLFVGRVELRKGIYELIEAINILNKKRDFLHFDIVGTGDFNDIKKRVEGQYNIVFHGQVNNKEKLLDIYRKADLFIFSSHDEGFPRVLYEAMMARVPIITTMVGGIGGFMKDRHNCLAIEEKKSQSIVDAVEEMLSSEEFRMKLVEQATIDILKLFDGTRKKHSELLKNKMESI